MVNISKIMLNDPSFTMDTNTVICNTNHKTLFLLYKFLLKFNIKRRMFTYPYALYKFNIAELRKIYVSYGDIYAELTKILDDSYDKDIKDVVIESIPFCTINNRYWNSIENNFRTNKKLQTVTNELQDFYNDDQYYTSKVKIEICYECKKKYNCY
jgi:hypothetical protein